MPDAHSIAAKHGDLASYYASKRAETAAALGNDEAAARWCILEAELEAKASVRR